MKFRRKNRPDEPAAEPDPAGPAEPTRPTGSTGSAQPVEEPEPADEAAVSIDGPFDIDEVDVPEDIYVDLGSVLIQPFEDSELRMQVEESSGDVLAVLLINEEGALEVRAFAAPRNGDLWSDARREIAADAARRGGTADERTGPFGSELFCQVPVTTDEGEAAVQPSRVIGCNGPRWFLRATLLGRPAVEPESAALWEDTIRAIVVRRGKDPVPPGEALPLAVPDNAQRVE
ncbi:MAG: DUF3710 domain-containing protein [Marmoricola sp.]